VPSSFDIGEGQVEKNVVASFQASTTSLPVAATDVSDWPYACTPLGLTSSLGSAASTFAENGDATARPSGFAACGAGAMFGPKQYICAPADARIP
jgi:hypothetical protein